MPRLRQYIGDTKTHAVELTLAGVPFDPTGYGLLFSAKRAAGDLDAAAAIQKATGAGITVRSAGGRWYADVEIVPADTTAEIPRTLECDVQAQHTTSGAVATVARLQLELQRDITRLTASSVPIFTANPPYPGTGGAAPQYTHTQASAAALWTINHNLGFRPAVELFDSGGAEIEAEVLHASNNQALVYFSTPTAGTARCN